MINISNLIKRIDILIEQNNTLVKKGSADSLEKKYFYITKNISNYIEEIIRHNKESIIKSINNKNKIEIIDLFAGSGMFTLLYSKYLLSMLYEENINLSVFHIILNDKLNSNSNHINWATLRKNYNAIKQNIILESEFITLSNIDLSNEEFIHKMENDVFTHVIANPMLIAMNKNNKHYKSISFINEDKLINNISFKKTLKNFISKSDYFIYLTKQLESNFTLGTHKTRKIYINDYTDLTITETEKIRYEIFNYINLSKMKEQNFWKFTNNQKENFNTIILFEKSQKIKTSKLKYVYNAIYGTNEQDSIKAKINQIKKKLEELKLNDIIVKYNGLKEKL
ncbi:MAG: hypothetical protein DRG78_04625 [Epsilonproteobacteria bacterium]|nr:MAG: hypothetical protein DRG78_04625 [Campylobacterota bacterium]